MAAPHALSTGAPAGSSARSPVRHAGWIRAVAAVAAGDALLSPGVTRRVIERFARRQDLAPDAGERLDALTTRELEVVRLVALGLSNGEIAERLVISPLTAKTHVARAIAKLDVRDRVQLVILAYESGLVRPGG
ncbi:response regulator transcription factor [Microbispora sp. KK1-11]|uniref:response regulator transcription factor n=1 Tax=Microbispora sp. KK1-11 TaxID=2053005 RepID=UPI0037C7FDC9